MIRIPNRTLGVLTAALCVSAAALTTAYAATPEPVASPAAGPDKTAPAKPVITSRPPSPTTVTSATFTYTHRETGVSFQCRLDQAGTFAPCQTSITYSDLAPGTHTFEVRALDGAGNASALTTFRWTIQRVVKTFSVRGNVTERIFPGAVVPIDVTVSNPFQFTIVVSGLTVTPKPETLRDGKPNPACSVAANLRLTQYSGKPFSVKPNRTVTLSGMGIASATWPKLRMLNLNTNQDACRDTTFAFTYSATATKR